MENLTKDDFNLNKEHEMFDVLYSVEKSTLTEIKVWCVIGHVLNSSANKRHYEYILVPYPISPYVMRNTEVRLSTLRSSGNFVATSKEEVIKLARFMVNEIFQEKLNALAKASDTA